MTKNFTFLLYFACLLIAVVSPGIQHPGGTVTTYTTTSKANNTQQAVIPVEQKNYDNPSPAYTADPDDIIEVPDAPETQGYVPTSIKDFNAADPTEGISLLSLPTVNNMGNAAMSFAMNLPQGRQGMEPSLPIQYNSEAGASWLGNGWNLFTPAVSIETRWGAPRYSAGLETEMYMLNGEQLAPVNNRSELQARVANKRFYQRVEGAFNKIIRHGSSPANYWWEVTQKDGTRNLYGGRNGAVVNGAVLKDDDGNIGYWALVETRDPNDNFVRYEYTTVNDSGLVGSTVPGKQLYLSQVTYTGNGTTDGAYKVAFLRDRQLPNYTKRKDVTIDARLGFKLVTADLLRRVDISFNNTIIRSYEFTYAEGAFYKTLLKSIKELDNAGNEFYKQEFDYFDDVRNNNSATDYKSADTSLDWSVPDDSLAGVLLNPLPGFSDKPSVINTHKASSFSAGGVVTIGTISGGLWSKKMSVGGGASYGQDKQEAVTTLIDINGDNLPDKVFKKQGRLYYRSNLGNHSFGEKRAILGIGDINYSEAESVSGGGQALPYTGFFGFNYTTTTTTTPIYFSDFNGDGLMDLADGGRVYFNHINALGDPEFTTNSNETPSPIFAGTVDPAFLQKDTARQAKQERDFPLQDVVRFWEAPFTGMVNITAPIQLLEVPNQTGIENNRKDGVRASIQLGGVVLDTLRIAADDFTVKPLNRVGLNVTRGQRIYFRLQSIYNGQDDLVNWDPVIQYTSAVTQQSDVQHKTSNYYRASEDFLLHSRSVTGMGKIGSIAIDGNFKKEVTSDSVFIKITRNRNSVLTTLFEKGFSGNEVVDENVPVPGSIAVDTGDEVHFALVSRSYIDRSAMEWRPHYAYVAFNDATPVTNSNGEPTIQGRPIPDNSNFNNWFIQTAPVTVSQQDTVTLWPRVTGGGNGTLWFTIKGTDTVYARRHIIMNGGTMSTAMDSIHLIRKANEPLFFEYATDTLDFAMGLAPSVLVYRDSSYLDTASNTIRDTAVLAATLPANLYANPAQEYMGSLFRGWGHFAYKGDQGNIAIDQSKLDLDELTSYPNDPNAFTDSSSMGNIQDPSKSDFVILFADLQRRSWLGYDTSVYITGGTMSSSRLYMHDVFVDTLTAGAGAVSKISTTEIESFSTGVTAGGFGPSGGTSSAATTINLDMMDMNGDRYPDIISGQRIQYTLPHGGLGPLSIDQSVGNTLSIGESQGLGFGGDYQEANTGNKTGKSAAGALKTAKSSMGLSGSVNFNEDDMVTTWMDINGDGLTDRVYSNGTVQLNLGYRFAAAEPWGLAGIDKAKADSYGAGIGVNIESGSFETGLGLSRTEGRNTIILNDINGDGLPDELSMSGDDVHVRFNTGNGFGPSIAWRGFDDVAKIFSVGESMNFAITVAIPIYIILMKICINPIGNVGQGMARQEKTFTDIDGDGFADYVFSNDDAHLTASSSAIGRTNMLKAVKGPLGASLSMDYERAGNTYNMPQSKWVLKNVSLYDGVKGDGVDTIRQQFAYEGGYHDRHEREFYGFSKVITRELNTANNNSIYRSHVEQYLNTSYYNKGLLVSEWLQDSAGRRYTQTNNVYDIKQVQDTFVRFPALIQTQTLAYEGGGTPGDSTVVQYEYDALGNVTTINDAGDGTQQDMTKTVITYHNVDALYIKSVPASVQVTTAEGVKRKRTTIINPQGDIIRINQFLADGTAAVTDMEYDDYGNMTKLTNPANYKNQRMSYTYEYDNTVHNYVTKITDAFGYITTNEYDYRFGEVTRTVSRNNETTEYTLDDLGRITSFTGPYELAAGKPYTIAIDYHPEAVVPYTITRHYDPEYNGDINVINFADGLGRSIQLKKQVSLFKGKEIADDERMVVSGKVFFDAFGRPVKALYPVTEAKGVVNTTLSTAQGKTASTTGYDVLNRPIKSVLADGATTTIAYSIASGMLSRIITDPLNNRKETLTDILDRKRMLKVYGPDGSITTRYDYNGLDELLKVTDNKGNAYTNTYDNLGRTISTDHPDAGLTEFEYDLAGNLRKKINAQVRLEIPNGGAIQYQYDYERLTDIDYPHHYQNKVKYTYGEPGTGVKAGRITLQQDGSGGQEFFYSMQGQVIKTIRTVLTSPQFSTTYVSETEYDSWNRVKKMVYPDGEEIMYHYNKSGGLHSMDGAKRGSSYKFVDQLGYDEYDQRVYMRYSNGTENFYQYDSTRRRLTQLRALASAGRAMMNNTYTYDAVSNVLSMVNDVQPQNGVPGGYAKQNYHYDNLYRLDSASGEYSGTETTSYGVKVAYDNLNNMVRKTMHGATSGQGYDNAYLYEGTAPHQATKIGSNQYSYDVNGNQLGYGDIENFYDEENRLMAVINKGVLCQYSYDASDNRVIKSSGGMQSIWVNGAPAGAVRHNENYTVYVSPYIACKRAEFIKHYYIEDQRVASKLGHGTFTNISFPQTGLSAGGVDYTRRAALIEQHRNEYYAELGVSPGPPTDKNFWARPENSGIPAPVFVDTTASDVPNGWPGNTTVPPFGPPVFVDTIPSRDSVKAGYGFDEAGHIYEGNIFFYHFDNVGSTSYVSNFQGEVAQHIEYSAFGEIFYSEHSGSFETPYLFNGKGLDNETGYYYYGPQFYDPALSQWLSVTDPLGESYLDAGTEGYGRIAGNNEDEEDEFDEIETVNFAIGKIAYNGSQETEKAWTDKKLNTKSRDKISKQKLRSMSKDPRVKILANKFGDRLERLQLLKSGKLKTQKTASRYNAVSDPKPSVSYMLGRPAQQRKLGVKNWINQRNAMKAAGIAGKNTGGPSRAHRQNNRARLNNNARAARVNVVRSRR